MTSLYFSGSCLLEPFCGSPVGLNLRHLYLLFDL
jgi:hypothetical protein